MRFEDSEHTFVIDIKLPGETEWITVSYERALEDRKNSSRNRELARGDKLSSAATGGAPVPEDRGTGQSGAGSAHSTASMLATTSPLTTSTATPNGQAASTSSGSMSGSTPSSSSTSSSRPRASGSSFTVWGDGRK